MLAFVSRYCFIMIISFLSTFISTEDDRQLSGGNITIHDSIAVWVAQDLTFNNNLFLFSKLLFCFIYFFVISV